MSLSQEWRISTAQPGSAKRGTVMLVARKKKSEVNLAGAVLKSPTQSSVTTCNWEQRKTHRIGWQQPIEAERGRTTHKNHTMKHNYKLENGTQ